MSIYSHWIIADNTEVQAFVEADYPQHHWPHRLDPGIGSSYLSFLWAILIGVKFDGSLSVTDKTLYFKDDEDGMIYVCTLNPAFVDLIATLPDDQFGPAAAAWAATEEMSRSTPEILEAYMREVAAFAKRSIELGKPILEKSIF